MITHDDGHLTWPDDFVSKIVCGNALAVLRQMPAACVDCVVTSPPYWGLRAYPGTEWWEGEPGCRHQLGADGYCSCGAWYGQLGLEPTWESYVEHLRVICREIHRVLAPHGSLWLNLGDTFLGSWGNYGARTSRQRRRHTPRLPRRGADWADRPPQSGPRVVAKHKVGLPFRVRFALNEDGWISRADVVWHKPNALPSSVQDRVGTRHEMFFHLVKSPRYFFDLDAIRVPHKMDTPKARHDLARMLTGAVNLMFPGSTTSATISGLSFVGGRQYFITMEAYNWDIIGLPFQVPAQFNMGFRAYPPFVAP
jgi:site-specific DNA-methyltransferase (cytosine-N4-specific)